MDAPQRGMPRTYYGGLAMAVGSPDYVENDDRANAIDTISNVLHAAHRRGVIVTPSDAMALLQTACVHFTEEVGVWRTDEPHVETNPAPADIRGDMPDPHVPLCDDCIDAYRNGIAPGETACEERAKGQTILPRFGSLLGRWSNDA